MNITLMTYSFVAIFYLIMGLLAFYNDKKSATNQLFLLVTATISFWAFCLAFMTASNDPVTAAFYRRIAVISWSSLYVEILVFVLFVTDRKKMYKKVWFRILITLPAVACFFIYFFSPVPAEFMIRINNAWAFSSPTDWGIIYDHFLTVYYASYIIISIILLIHHSINAKFIRIKKQARLIYISFILVAVLGSVSDIILPSLGYQKIPPLTVVLSLIPIVGVWYSIGKFSMMNLSSEKIQIKASEVMNEGIVIIDNKNNVIHVNNGAKKMLECENLDISDFAQERRIFPKEIWDLEDTLGGHECNISTFLGHELSIIVSKNIIRDNFGEKFGETLYFQDITPLKNMQEAVQKEKEKLETEVLRRTRALKKSNKKLKKEVELRIGREKEIEKIAYSDHLTGLPNRRMFTEHLQREIKRVERTNIPFAIFYIDLDGFKNVNDSLGHSCGDMLLKQVSKRLVKTLRGSDLVTRIGGDEFAIIVFNSTDYESIEIICKKLLKRIEEPYEIQDSEVRISASIGISFCPNDSIDPVNLMKYADIAMYEAKESGKGKYSFFDKEKRSGLEERMTLTNDLYHALENNELEVYYQPQISTKTKKIIGFEALVRWNHPELGFLVPNKFISIAESCELINPIGKWVLETACRQLKEWNKIYNRNMSMAINLSPIQLENPKIKDEIINVIKDVGISPNLIELEITEDVLMKDFLHVSRTLNELKEEGVNIAIDDYGTKYSSLSYIRHLTANRIKIPKLFIDGINENKNDESIVISTIQLAKKLGLNIVAEGVEQEHQYKYLLDHECDTIQGYYFFKPMPAFKVEEELSTALTRDTNDKSNKKIKSAKAD